MSKTAIQSGPIELNWVVRAGRRSRPFMVGFHFADVAEGIAIHINESELMAFNRFQRRSLAVGAGYPELTGSASAAKRVWSSAVSEAIKAGQSIDMANCPGFKLIGGDS